MMIPHSRFLIRSGIAAFFLFKGIAPTFGQSPAAKDFVASYISIEAGGTFSWLPGANNFFFPYASPYQTIDGSPPQKMYFNKLGSGFGYTVGLTSELPVFPSNALRIGAHYYTLSTQSTDEQMANCSSAAGTSGQAIFHSTYKSTWTFASADILIRQLLFSKSFYLLFGGDISYLISDQFDATQRIISTDGNCQYYTVPDGKPTGRTDLSVSKQTSTNLYNKIHYSLKFGCGIFLSLGNDFFISPEVQVSYPIQHLYTDDAESAFSLNHTDVPRLWHADLLVSFRYAIPIRHYLEEKQSAIILNSVPPVQAINPEYRKGLMIAGKIKNCSTGAPVIADLLVSNLDSSTVVENTQANIVGSFTIPVPHPGRYSVTATAKGYLFSSVLFDVSDTISGSKILHDIILCQEGGKVTLLVFFDYDKAELQPSSFAELDRAARLIKESPTMTVEIAGYTDSKGSEEYNQDLSERRANAVRTYLLSKNINAERIVAKGYGKKNPVASNETDAGRAENRRVEFVVVKP